MIHELHSIVWGPVLIGLLLFCGLFFTVKSEGFQFRGVSIWWKSTVGSLFREEDKERKAQNRCRDDSINKIQAACTALAATIGTGNIVGVASALTAGGPGAIFWVG